MTYRIAISHKRQAGRGIPVILAYRSLSLACTTEYNLVSERERGRRGGRKGGWEGRRDGGQTMDIKNKKSKNRRNNTRKFPRTKSFLEQLKTGTRKGLLQSSINVKLQKHQ